MPLRTLTTCLTLSPPIFCDVALVEEAHVHVALGQLVGQDVLDLRQLELGVAEQGDLLVLELDGGGGALEVEARADFLGGVFHGVLHLHHVRFADGIE